MNLIARPSLPRPQVSGLHGEAGALALYDWAMPASKPLGTVILVHGLGEHAGRYGEVAAHLHQWGFAVRAYDQQGHGQSEGARGDMLRPGSLQADLCRVIDDTRQHPSLQGTPLILLGHSMGGLVVARTLAEGLRPVDAVVLSSPALGAFPNFFQKMLLASLPRVLPHLRVDNGLKPEFVSRDPDVVKAYKADPLVHRRISAGRKGRKHWQMQGIGRCPLCCSTRGKTAWSMRRPVPTLRGPHPPPCCRPSALRPCTTRSSTTSTALRCSRRSSAGC